ncbi:unnamed protein product [Brassica rapa subsp. trilocularis]
MVDEFLMTATPFSVVAPPDLSTSRPRPGISTLPSSIHVFFSKFATGLPSPYSGDLLVEF